MQMPMLKRPMQPVMMQQKPNILEQNAQLHQQKSEKEKNLPGILLGILVLIVVILVGIFAYFYFTR